MKFQNRLNKVISITGLPKHAVASLCGVHRNSLASYLSGSRQPNRNFYVKLTKICPDLDLNWLITGKRLGGNRKSSTVAREQRNFEEETS